MTDGERSAGTGSSPAGRGGAGVYIEGERSAFYMLAMLAGSDAWQAAAHQRREGSRQSVAGKGFPSDIRKVETMNIGEVNVVKGRLEGRIATRTIDLPRIGLRKVDSMNERAPAYEILTLNVARRWVQIGALWEAAAKRTGEVFLAGNIDDPSLPEPLPIALFPSESGYSIAWRRDTLRSDAGGSGFAGAASFGGQRGPEDLGQGGFGSSTAGANGELTERRADDERVEDEIPF